MKRLLQCAVMLVLLASFFTLTGGTLAHAATRSTQQADCGASHSQEVYINAQGTNHYLGYMFIYTNGCGGAEGAIYAAQTSYRINHLWVRDSHYNNISWDFGNVAWSADTGWWGVNTSCAIVSGVIQNGSDWGSASTNCLNVNG